MSMDTRQVTSDSTRKHISAEERSRILAELILREYDQLRGQERDIIQARNQIWAGAILLLSILAVVPGYAATIGPLVFASMARSLRGGEIALRTIRPYLRELEVRYDYQGYERYYDTLDIKEHGSGAKAVRDTLWLCEVLTVAIVGIHLWNDHPPLTEIIVVSGIAAVITGVAAYVTWRWMKTPPKPRPKEQSAPGGTQEAAPQTHQSQAQEGQPLPSHQAQRGQCEAQSQREEE